MYQITVAKNGFIEAVYYNSDRESGLTQAKIAHGDKCDYRVRNLDSSHEEPVSEHDWTNTWVL